MATKAEDETFVRIEETQAALRDSIEQAREFAEESDRLVRQCRDGAEHDDRAGQD